MTVIKKDQYKEYQKPCSDEYAFTPPGFLVDTVEKDGVLLPLSDFFSLLDFSLIFRLISLPVLTPTWVLEIFCNA
jgi:hypothetical protein